MPLIGSDALLARINHLVGTSTHVDIAVAWAGPGLAVELLLENVHEPAFPRWMPLQTGPGA